MSWLDRTWKYRAAFSIHNASGATGADLDFLVPSDWDLYWNTSLANLNDVRWTAADGLTLLDFQATANSSHANQSVTFNVNNYSWNTAAWGGNAGANQSNASIKAYMYFGNDTLNLASGQSTAFNINDHIANAITPGLQLARPGSSSAPVIECGAQAEGQTVPTQTVVKQSTDNTIVWWDLRKCMNYRARRSSGSVLLEEIAWVLVSIVRADGTNLASSMLEHASVSFSNHHIVSHTLKGGTDGDNSLLTLTVGTDDGMGNTRVLEYNCNVKIRDLIASTT